MTLTQAREMLDRIKVLAASGDYEAAHAIEDTLHLEALVTIANDEHMTGERRRHLAWLAASSNDIPFMRVAA